MLLEYAEGDRLYVPIEQTDRVAAYIGTGNVRPGAAPARLGDWTRDQAPRAEAATVELARELLALYAAREAAPGHAYTPDTPWQEELEAAFPYVETEDQMRAIEEVKTDMEQPRPMDRLICGDVGYGKTEVAMRAAFKAVMDGKQVAVLVPTTILAQQHFTTFREPHGRLPGHGRDALALPHTASSRQQILADLAAGQRRYRHRHPPAAAKGRAVQGPGPGRRGRGAALRRAPQGAAQAAAPARWTC